MTMVFVTLNAKSLHALGCFAPLSLHAALTANLVDSPQGERALNVAPIETG